MLMAIVLLGCVVSLESLSTYLTHKAAKNIEHFRPLRLQRPGLYPDHASEDFFTVWMGFVALLLVLFAAWLLTSFSTHYRAIEKFPAKLYTAFIATLCAAIGYVVWYYRWEFHRISPDLSSAGLVANWVDWMGGGLIALIAVTFAAVRLSDSTEFLTQSDKESRESYCVQPSLFGLLSVGTILISSIQFAWSIVSEIVLQPQMYPGFNPTVMVLWSLSDPQWLLLVAVYLLAAQIAWRWLRSGPPKNCIAAIDSNVLCFTWWGLIALISVSIPLLAAFGFSFWLGPWSPF
jgi:hypothetical protein